MNKILKTITILTLFLMMNIRDIKSALPTLSTMDAYLDILYNVENIDLSNNIDFQNSNLDEIKQNTSNVFNLCYNIIVCERSILYHYRNPDSRVEVILMFIKEKFEEALKKDFDINATRMGCKYHLIIEILGYFMEDIYDQNLKHIIHSNTDVLDKLLEGREIFLCSHDIEEMFDKFSRFWSKDCYSLNEGYTEKIIGYVKKFLSCTNFYPFQHYFAFSDGWEYFEAMYEAAPSLKQELENIVREKDKAFFNSVINYVNNCDLDGLKNLLSSLDNEDINSYFEKCNINLRGIKELLKLLNKKVNSQDINLDTIKKLSGLLNNEILRLCDFYNHNTLIEIGYFSSELNNKVQIVNIDGINTLSMDPQDLSNNALIGEENLSCQTYLNMIINPIIGIISRMIDSLEKNDLLGNLKYLSDNICCDNYLNLIKMVAYLNHNSMEVAIRQAIINKVNTLREDSLMKVFRNNASVESLETFPSSQIFPITKQYKFMKILFEQYSPEEALSFFQKPNYLLLVKTHFLLLNPRETLPNTAFIITHPEYDPVTIAFNARNYGIANYFIRDSESLYNDDELIELSHLHKNANATKEEILALDMKAVNFSSLFADSINNGNFDIAYNILYSFSDDLDNYSDLSGNTGNALRSIYNEALIQIINQDRRNNPQSSSIATISQTHNITKDQFDAIVNPLLESTLDYDVSYDERNISNDEREVLSNNDAYIFPNSIKTIGNPYTSRIMMLVEDIEDKLFN